MSSGRLSPAQPEAIKGLGYPLQNKCHPLPFLHPSSSFLLIISYASLGFSHSPLNDLLLLSVKRLQSLLGNYLELLQKMFHLRCRTPRELSIFTRHLRLHDVHPGDHLGDCFSGRQFLHLKLQGQDDLHLIIGSYATCFDKRSCYMIRQVSHRK